MTNKRILHLPVKKLYFEQIKSGEKTNEYRLTTEYWQRRIVGRTYDEVHIKLGYPKATDSSHILIFPWSGYDSTTLTHEHFGEKPVDVFAIRLVNNNFDVLDN